MNVFIASSASKLIDDSYLKIARETSEYLADKGFDLVFGGASFSMMGECFKTFLAKGRNIEAFTVKAYEDDLKKLVGANCHLVEDTLVRFKKMYDLADIILILPGGIGTLAELASALEEYRSNNEEKLIIIYNQEGYYDYFFKWIDENIDRGFLISDIKKDYKVINDLDSFKENIEKYMEARYEN